MKALPFVASIALGAAALAPACSANPLVVGLEVDSGGPSACEAAGGVCVPAAVACANMGPSSAQECDITGNPAGAGNHCCLTFPDASSGRDAGAADARPGGKDGGDHDSGSASACASAGGACVQSSVACAETAPPGAQDCNTPLNPGAAHCCLSLPDAGPGLDAGPRDASPDRDAGRSGDSGTSPMCAAAGGTCIDPSRACGKNAPMGPAQDCPFAPGGSFCCLMPL